MLGQQTPDGRLMREQGAVFTVRLGERPVGMEILVIQL